MQCQSVRMRTHTTVLCVKCYSYCSKMSFCSGFCHSCPGHTSLPPGGVGEEGCWSGSLWWAWGATKRHRDNEGRGKKSVYSLPVFRGRVITERKDSAPCVTKTLMAATEERQVRVFTGGKWKGDWEVFLHFSGLGETFAPLSPQGLWSRRCCSGSSAQAISHRRKMSSGRCFLDSQKVAVQLGPRSEAGWKLGSRYLGWMRGRSWFPSLHHCHLGLRRLP